MGENFFFFSRKYGISRKCPQVLKLYQGHVFLEAFLSVTMYSKEEEQSPFYIHSFYLMHLIRQQSFMAHIVFMVIIVGTTI